MRKYSHGWDVFFIVCLALLTGEVIFTFRLLATNKYELIRSCKNKAVRPKEQSLISSQNSLQNTTETIVLVPFGVKVFTSLAYFI